MKNKAIALLPTTVAVASCVCLDKKANENADTVGFGDRCTAFLDTAPLGCAILFNRRRADLACLAWREHATAS